MNFRRIEFMLAVCAGLSSAIAPAQTPPSPAVPSAFEVASIRASGPQSHRGSEGGPGSKSPTLYRYNAATLQDLIMAAWNVDPFQVSSATPVDRDKFDLSVRVPDGATREQFRAMLQNLLAERFGLKTHTESRDFQAYVLVVAKTGLKLIESVAGENAVAQGANDSGPCGQAGWPEMPPNRSTISANLSFHEGSQLNCVVVQAEPFSMLARMLPTENRMHVIDETGLAGKYTFRLEYAIELPGAAVDAPAIAPDISTALQEQLGLQLVQKKLPFDVVVVDSFNKMPTEN